MHKHAEYEHAKALYMQYPDMPQKEIADQVGVTQGTIARWINDYAWEDERRGLAMTKQNVERLAWKLAERFLKDLGVLVDNLDAAIEPKHVDMVMKLSKALNNISGVRTLDIYIDVLREELNWVYKEDLELAKKLAELQSRFIRHVRDKQKEVSR